MSAPAPVAYVNGPNVVTGDGLNTFCQGGMLKGDLENFVGLPGMTAFLIGLAADNDGDGGFFYWVAGGTANDGVNNIQPFGVASGCWTRVDTLTPSGSCGALGIINVTCDPYNATGDGVTDDTVAIQAALDAVGDGSEVWFPPGTYLTDTLTINSNTMLSGAGKTVSNIVSLSGNTIFTNAASTTANVEIRDMALYGENYLTAGAASGIGIAFTGVDGTHRPSVLRFTNLDMRGFAQAIRNYLCANTYYTDLFITLCSAGIWSNTCADTNIEQVEVQNSLVAADNTGYGFRVTNDGSVAHANEGIRLANVSTNGQFGGLLVQNQDFGNCTNFSFSSTLGNTVVLAGAQNWKMSTGEIDPASAFASLITTVGSSANATTQCAFTGIQFAGGTFGVSIDGRQITLTGCVFTGNTNGDIVLGATARSVNVLGNVCQSTGIAASVAEIAGADYNLISSNSVIGTVTLTGAHSSAVNNLVIV